MASPGSPRRGQLRLSCRTGLNCNKPTCLPGGWLGFWWHWEGADSSCRAAMLHSYFPRGKLGVHSTDPHLVHHAAARRGVWQSLPEVQGLCLHGPGTHSGACRGMGAAEVALGGWTTSQPEAEAALCPQMRHEAPLPLPNTHLLPQGSGPGRLPQGPNPGQHAVEGRCCGPSWAVTPRATNQAISGLQATQVSPGPAWPFNSSPTSASRGLWGQKEGQNQPPCHRSELTSGHWGPSCRPHT